MKQTTRYKYCVNRLKPNDTTVCQASEYLCLLELYLSSTSHFNIYKPPPPKYPLYDMNYSTSLVYPFKLSKTSYL